MRDPFEVPWDPQLDGSSAGCVISHYHNYQVNKCR
jgi:hypothetical protein